MTMDNDEMQANDKDSTPVMTTKETIGGANSKADSDKVIFGNPDIEQVDSTPKEVGMGKVTGARDGQTTPYKGGDLSFLRPRK